MVSSAVINLANNLGASLSERVAHDSYLFDGKTIALYGRRYLNRKRFGGRLGLNVDEVDPVEMVPFSDHDILHELGHWVMAEECQKDLPEYGLTIGIAALAFGPRGGEFLTETGKLRDNIYPDALMGVVDRDEADIQDCGAQLLSSYWGRTLNISVSLSSEPNFFRDWDHYDLHKIEQSRLIDSLNYRMIAAQRLLRTNNYYGLISILQSTGLITKAQCVWCDSGFIQETGIACRTCAGTGIAIK
jgi:hypothetical protein